MVRNSAAKPPASKTVAPVKRKVSGAVASKKSVATPSVPAATAKRSATRAKAPLIAKKSSAQPTVTADKPVKVKQKLVRDSFTMPKPDFDLIAVLKERALGFRQPVKKSELLRAGLRVLSGLPDDTLKATLGALEALKPGRPKTTPE